MSGWRRCETCRKVRAVDDYDDDATTCRPCLSAPPARRKAAPVVRSTRSPAAAAEVTPRRSLMGPVGSGDLEARERRAKRTAWEQLAELHPEEYGELLQAARLAEGLRT